MKNIDHFQSFAKGKTQLKNSGKNAIIYTRVSSKEQSENMSLEVQLKGCLHYAEKNHLQIKGQFGGTYESAQTDERNEFKRMIHFAKTHREGISYIIVYSLERFSRTGENAIWLSRQLRELGITIISVSQPIDTSNPAGVLQQNILFLFSQYDNDLRRQKCVDGMHEKLLKGEWVGGVPLGYSYDYSHGTKEQRIVINEKGKFVRRAFEMKLNEGLSNTQIVERVNKMGLKVSKQKMTEIFKNTFYCGLLSHNLLNGEVVKGKHQPLIDREMFLKVNEVISAKNVSGYKQQKFDENIPLKQFVQCADCGTPFTGYLVKKKNLYYYKCNRIGCKCNRSAKHLHGQFKNFLSDYQLDSKHIAPLKVILEGAYSKIIESSGEETKSMKSKLTELNNKLLKVEERFAIGEIDREIYERIAGKMKEERAGLEDVLENSQKKLSNPAETINKSLEIVSNLVGMWDSGGYQDKHNLQRLLFPKGISYDRKIDNYRTDEVNEVIRVTRYLSKHIEENKKGQAINSNDLSGSVVLADRLLNPLKTLYTLNQEVTRLI